MILLIYPSNADVHLNDIKKSLCHRKYTAPFTNVNRQMWFREITADYPKNHGTAVAQWLMCCAKNRKVAGSIPAGVIGIFHWHKIIPIAL